MTTRDDGDSGNNSNSADGSTNIINDVFFFIFVVLLVVLSKLFAWNFILLLLNWSVTRRHIHTDTYVDIHERLCDFLAF